MNNFVHDNGARFYGSNLGNTSMIYLLSFASAHWIPRETKTCVLFRLAESCARTELRSEFFFFICNKINNQDTGQDTLPRKIA